MIAAMKYDSQAESNSKIDASMSLVVRAVKLGDEEAVRHIWKRYFPELVRLAGQRLTNERNGLADGEDVAISAMESFFRAARKGRFPDGAPHQRSPPSVGRAVTPEATLPHPEITSRRAPIGLRDVKAAGRSEGVAAPPLTPQGPAATAAP